MKSKIICFLFLAAVLSSCTHDYYQIFTVTPLDAVKKNSVDNYLVYEDDICKVTYNFWGQGGWRGFAVYNYSINRGIFNRILLYKSNESHTVGIFQ